MIHLKTLQKEVVANKQEKGFNTTNIYQEFCLLHEEVSEACTAYMRKYDDLGEELADVAIFLLGIAELLNIDLEAEIIRKIAINKKRQYAYIDGVHTRIDP
jgi:NTP pyrophosphatase (non-canonical NTP hydrolase)